MLFGWIIFSVSMFLINFLFLVICLGLCVYDQKRFSKGRKESCRWGLDKASIKSVFPLYLVLCDLLGCHIDAHLSLRAALSNL